MKGEKEEGREEEKASIQSENKDVNFHHRSDKMAYVNYVFLKRKKLKGSTQNLSELTNSVKW